VRIKSQKDFAAGLMFMGVGIAFAIGAMNYTIGDGARMGPGYFPRLLGFMLAGLGAIITYGALVVETEDGEPIGAIAWKPLLLILGANVVFGILLGGVPKLGIPSFGMIAGIYALVFIASLAGDNFRPLPVFILATVLAVISYLAFIVLLNLQIPTWPSFLIG
jgi:hypothetical protein